MNLVKLLRESIRYVPANAYAFGVVGVVSAAALALRMAGDNWILAVVGGVAVLAGMVLLRIFAGDSQPEPPRDSPMSLQRVVLFWICLIAFVLVLAMGIGKLYVTLFPSSSIAASSPAHIELDRRFNSLRNAIKGNISRICCLSVQRATGHHGGLEDEFSEIEQENLALLKKAREIAGQFEDWGYSRYMEDVIHYSTDLSEWQKTPEEAKPVEYWRAFAVSNNSNLVAVIPYNLDDRKGVPPLGALLFEHDVHEIVYLALIQLGYLPQSQHWFPHNGVMPSFDLEETGKFLPCVAPGFGPLTGEIPPAFDTRHH